MLRGALSTADLMSDVEDGLKRDATWRPMAPYGPFRSAAVDESD